MPDVRRGLGEEAAEVTTVPKRQFSLPAGRQGDGRRAAIARPASSHIFRHTCAAHLLEDGYDIRTVQELLGHKDLSPTMIYARVSNRGLGAVRSPADRLLAP